MVATYTTNIGLIKQGTGDNSGTWGAVLNSQMIDLVDSAVAGVTTIATGTVTGGNFGLTATAGTANQARAAVINVTSALTSNLTLTTPAGVTKSYVIANNTSNAFTLSISIGTGVGAGSTPSGTPVAIPQGTVMLCYTDGTNYYLVSNASTGLQGTAIGSIDMNSFLFDRPLIKRYKEFENALGNTTGALALSYNNGNVQSMTLTGNVTATLSNWPTSGTAGSMTLKCTQDGTGSRTLSFAGSTVKVPGGGGLVLSTTPGAVDMVFLFSDDGGTTLYCSILQAFA